MVSNSDDFVLEMPSNDENIDMEEEIFNFEQEKDNLFQNLLSSIIKSKVQHSLPNDALDEILIAVTEASRKSNLILKEQLKEAISSQNRKLLKNCAGAYFTLQKLNLNHRANYLIVLRIPKLKVSKCKSQKQKSFKGQSFV